MIGDSGSFGWGLEGTKGRLCQDPLRVPSPPQGPYVLKALPVTPR